MIIDEAPQCALRQRSEFRRTARMNSNNAGRMRSDAALDRLLIADALTTFAGAPCGHPAFYYWAGRLADRATCQIGRRDREIGLHYAAEALRLSLQERGSPDDLRLGYCPLPCGASASHSTVTPAGTG